ncbi:MAG TPA: tetratricopeptide repeat protein, partial [Pyrinomonadaceae bacterium]|nr:tetratricopeptide repeat protein [Pyrinomonadaceae bacterium]
MKRCPECRRGYFDDTLLYCLDDGNALLEGPRSFEPRTAILSDVVAPGDEPTRIFDANNDSNCPMADDAPRKDRKGLASYRVVVSTVLFAAIVVAAIAYFASNTNKGFPRSTPAIASIMVLPLKSIGPEDEYLSDGLTDELTSRLTKLKTVRVVAPSSAMRYKNSPKDAAEIGREMHVEAVIEGTVRKQGDKFRVSLHLINAADGFDLWSDSNFEGDEGDLLGAQSRLAELMASRLRGELTSQEKNLIGGRSTTNADAYELYLKGKQQFRSGQNEIAHQMFDRAINLDPAFAEAYAWRGRVVYEAFKTGRSDRSSLDAGLDDANRALQIDPNLIAARSTLISIYHSTGQYEEGLKQGKLALQTNPDDLDAIEGAALAYFRAGMINKAIPLYEQAVAADPTSSAVRKELARADLANGEYQKGIDAI